MAMVRVSSVSTAHPDKPSRLAAPGESTTLRRPSRRSARRDHAPGPIRPVVDSTKGRKHKKDRKW